MQNSLTHKAILATALSLLIIHSSVAGRSKNRKYRVSPRNHLDLLTRTLASPDNTTNIDSMMSGEKSPASAGPKVTSTIPSSPKRSTQQTKASSTIYSEVMRSLSLKERSESNNSASTTKTITPPIAPQQPKWLTQLREKEQKAAQRNLVRRTEAQQADAKRAAQEAVKHIAARQAQTAQQHAQQQAAQQQTEAEEAAFEHIRNMFEEIEETPTLVPAPPRATALPTITTSVPTPEQEAAPQEAAAEQGKAKAQDCGNRVSLTTPQILVIDTITSRMQGWIDDSLPGAGEDGPPTDKIVPWISGHYGASIQGKTTNNPGYKVNFSGFSVGSDFITNDEVKLGLSYSNITSKLRVKENQNADSTKSHTVSIYGQYNFTKDIFAQSAIAYTVGSSKNRPNNLNSYKVSSNGLGGFITLNKDFLLDSDILITPRIGLRYIESKEKDVNLGRGNKVKGAKNRYFTGIIGATLYSRKQLTDGTLLRPMLYAGLEKNFITKSKAPIARIEEAGRPFEYQNTTTPQKISYVLGTGLSAKRNNLLLSVSYQCSLAKKYISHHGILKLGLAL